MLRVQHKRGLLPDRSRQLTAVNDMQLIKLRERLSGLFGSTFARQIANKHNFAVHQVTSRSP